MSIPKHALWVAGGLALAALACIAPGVGQVAEQAEPPQVAITSPADGSEVPLNEQLAVQIAITDPGGIVTQVQLKLDEVIVATQNLSPTAGLPIQTASLSFTPTEAGAHVLAARVFGSDGSTSEPAIITLMVTEEGASEVEPTEEAEAEPAQAAPTVNPTAVPDEARGCTNDTRFVADVTIPDGTEMSPGEAFTKTWTIRNAGTCDWGGYQLVFHSGDQMGGPSAVTVPATPAGNTTDVSVPLIAPADPGTHTSRWTIRAPDGTLFGIPIFAKITVVEESTPEPPAQPQPPPIPDWPLVKQGAQGAEVYAIQYLLRAHGYSLTADGIFGNITRTTVQQFQGDEGLAVDGIVGKQTWNALIDGKTVQNGSSGDAVKAVQQLLNDKFGYSLVVDGLFGTKTDQAVRDFQTDYGLDVDGIVGKQTWKALVAFD